jgi:DNA polymerase I
MLLKMQLLDADYFLNNNKPIVRLFGRTENGDAACVFCDWLEPYFYVKPRGGKKIGTLLDEIDAFGKNAVKEITEVEMFLPRGYQSKKTKLMKITLVNPQDTPRMREKMLTSGVAEEIFEADIMFKYRFMIDSGVLGMQWLEIECDKTPKTVKSKIATYAAKSVKQMEKTGNAQLRYLAFDIECVPSSANKPLDAKTDPVIMISMAFYPEWKGRKTYVLTARPFSGNDVQGFASEKEMIEEFVRIVENFDPDIVTGYNINSFDFPYLVERMRQNKISSTLGRADKDIFSRTYGISSEYVITGRIVADPYQILKRDPWVKFHRYDLRTIAKAMLNESKLDVSYGEIPALWNGDREKISRLVEYARKDAELSLRLILDKGLLDKFFEVSKISGLLLQDTLGGQTRRIEIMLMHEFRKRGFVMPASPSRQELHKRLDERTKKGLKGAIVLEPKKGLHAAEGCVLVLDFKSLYPSIMRTFNVSPDTVLIEDGVAEENKHASPAGVYFVNENLRKGIFPDVLSGLIDMRARIKKEMRTKKGEEKRILNAKQLALKDMSNSFYGYIGYVRARLYMIDVASTITGYGRENIEKTKKLIEENFNVEIVYGDTDSIFVKTRITNLDEARELGERIAKFATENLPGLLELEFEKIYRTFLILTKKRYAGWRFDKADGAWADEIEMRGIETVRRDWCPLVSDVMMNVLNTILKEGDVQKAIETVKAVLDKLRKNEIPMEKLTIIKGITQPLASYKGMLPHIEAARKMAARSPHTAPKIGDRVGFVIVKGSEMLSKRAEDPAYAEHEKLQIDSDYYIQSQLFPPIERILSAVGVERSDVLGNGHQLSLGDMLSGRKRTMRHSIEVSYNKNKTEALDDSGHKQSGNIILGGWEGFACSTCSKSYRRPPLRGTCDCGSPLLISWHGSTGTKVVLK